jgi:hypothetical protein
MLGISKLGAAGLWAVACAVNTVVVSALVFGCCVVVVVVPGAEMAPEVASVVTVVSVSCGCWVADYVRSAFSYHIIVIDIPRLRPGQLWCFAALQFGEKRLREASLR